MNHYHVKYFVDAVRFKSLVASAKANFVTHPAVSQAIRTLEGELNCELISHKKRQFQITTQGEEFFTWAQKWLSQIDEVKDELKHSKEQLAGTLIMAGAQSITADFIGPEIFKMKKAHPKVNFRYSFGEARYVRELVREGSVHLGFIVDDDYTSEFETEIICEGSFVLVSHSKRATFDTHPLIVTNTDKVEVQTLFKALNKKKIDKPNVFMELASWSLIRRFAAENDIIGFVPEFVVENELKDRSLFRIDLGITVPRYRVIAIWNKSGYQSRLQKEFLKNLKAEH